MVEAVNAIPPRPAQYARAKSRWLLGFTLVSLWLQPLTARAHRLDEYLQAALISIEPDTLGVELNLTPGVETFSRLLPQLDADQDGRLSELEMDAYAHRVGTELSLRIDGHPLVMKVGDRQFAPLADLRSGLGGIQLEFSAPLPPIPAGPHEVQFENRHRPDLSVYLVNAILPRSPAVQVVRQNRNENQSQSRIDFTLTPVQATATTGKTTSPGGVGILLGLAGLGILVGLAWRLAAGSA